MTPNPADELAKLSNEELSDQLTHFGNQGDSWVDWSRLIAEAARRLRASPPVAPASSAAGTREIISEGSCPECGKSSQDYGRFRKSDKFEAGDADGEIYECGYCGSTQQPVADDTPPALPSSGLGEAVTNSQWTRGNRPKSPQGEYLITVQITDYLVTQEEKAIGVKGEPRTERLVCDAFYKPGDGWITGGHPREETADNKVIAWMRKPEPYSGAL